MTPAFEEALSVLKKLPGLGYRSAERIALHLLVEKPGELGELLKGLEGAVGKVKRCEACGNIAEDALCAVCSNGARDQSVICVTESIPDLYAIERSGAYNGVYHVLHGKLSPIKGVGPEDLSMCKLEERIESGEVREMILALGNDIEGEATCHYIQEKIVGEREIEVSRIGFGLPSGGGVVYADSATLKSALDGRRTFSEV